MKFEYTIVKPSEDSAVITVPLNAQMEIFDGHFESIAIMPAVAQLYMVQKLAKKHFNITGKFQSMRQVKFVDVIFADTTVEIHLTHHNNSIKFEFHEHHKLKSKGSLPCSGA